MFTTPLHLQIKENYNKDQQEHTQKHTQEHTQEHTQKHTQKHTITFIFLTEDVWINGGLLVLFLRD